ncbi:hypothetical protein [Limnohabitans sp. Hippo4]|uniref:beta strand repeat-containing protein n=1 Tax=Limnohabitans sp. Hippo4 TaxID=1826167 RepID=UPI000D381AA0|nr:hypothetical protein [Limnohabitans sp. Hippo4]PUE31991.1 hypothetical protein B9Z46_14555 [Limnohabitans sp. Hippo4]
MAISTNGTIIARLAGGLYNTVLSNATYLEVVAQDPSALANKLYAADFAKKTDAEVGTILVTNLGLASLTGLDAWVAAQLTAAGANKGAKVVELLNGFAQMTADTTYGTYATAFNAKVDAALAASQTTGKAEGKFETAGVTAPVTSFTLTTSVDTIVGSAGDDTITAPATVATTGAAQTTINSGDSIDGGAGNDTLTITITAANNNSLTGLTVKNVENISYVGSDNLASGSAAVAAATTAAATAAATLASVIGANTAAAAAAVASQIAYDAARTVQDAAMNTVTKFTNLAAGKNPTGGALSAETPAGVATDYGLTLVGTTNTLAGLKAAAAAALKAADGTATTDATIEARADALAATAALVDTGADAAVTAITTATTGSLAVAYAADASAKAALAGAKAAITANASIAANADATSITIDGAATDVTSLKDTQTVTVSGATAAANTLKYGSTATNAKLALAGSTGTFTFTDSSSTAKATLLAAATVTGSVAAATAATTTAGAVPGTVTLVDRVAGTTTGDTIKTLNLGITSNATVTITDLTAVTTIDGSTSTGGLTLAPLASTLNVTTGAGADSVTFIAATDLTNAAKLTSSLATGAGNDVITVNVSGGGTSAVNAGAGDDTITMTSAVGSAVVDGGDGKDTVVLGTTTFSVGAYNSLKANVLNTEVLSLTGVATVRADKTSQFTEYTFAAAGGVISKVADTQKVNANASTTITAAGYASKGSTDVDTGDTATVTAYAGALNVAAKGTTTVTAQASSITLDVATVPTVLNGVTTYANSAVTLTGDVKSATIAVNKSADNSKLTGADRTASITIAPTNADDDVTAAVGAWTNLGALTSVTLTGTGSATVTNSGTGSKLATIDASGLNGTLLFSTGTTAGTVKGDATAGLSWTAGTLTESVKLGAALDTLTFGALSSTYAKMDSITGYSLAANAAGDLVTAKSDNITFGGAVTFVAKTTGVSGSLDAALTAAGSHTVATVAADAVVFQNGGNTYIYRDIGANGLDDNDTVIELVGLVDLTLLIADLAA